MSVKLLPGHHLEFQGLKRGCTGSSEFTLVKIPHCWKSHVAAHMSVVLNDKKRTKDPTLFISAERVCRLYIPIVPSSLTVITYLPLGLTETLLILLAISPMSKRSLQVWILINLIIPSWHNTPRTYKVKNIHVKEKLASVDIDKSHYTVLT